MKNIFVIILHLHTFQAVSKQQAPEIVKEFITLLQSEAIFIIFSQLTGLRLHNLALVEEEEESVDAVPGSSGENTNKKEKGKSKGESSNHRDEIDSKGENDNQEPYSEGESDEEIYEEENYCDLYKGK